MNPSFLLAAFGCAAVAVMIVLLWDARRHFASEPPPAALSDAASDAVLAISEDGRMVYANPAAHQVFGYPAKALVGRQLTMLMPEGLRDVHRRALARYVETGERRLDWERIDFPALRHDGAVIAVEMSLGERWEDERRLFVGVARDVTERHRTIDMLRLKCAVSEALAADAPFADVSVRVLRAICEATRWDAAELWMVDEAVDALRLEHVWTSDAVEPTALLTDARRVTLKRGRGLLGTVWQSNQARAAVDALTDIAFRRGDAARATGLRGAFAVPVRSGGKVAAVLACYSRRATEPGPELLATLEGMSEMIGASFQRLRAEAQLREHALRLRVLADVSLELAEVHPDVRLTLEAVARNTAERLGDLCLCLLIGERGDTFDVAAYHHRRPDAVMLIEELRDTVTHLLDKTPAGRVISKGRPLFIPVVTPEQIKTLVHPDYWPYVERVGLHSLVVVPLKARGTTVGAILVARDEPARPFGYDDLLFMQQLAGRAALAILNAQECACGLTGAQGYAVHNGQIERPPRIAPLLAGEPIAFAQLPN